MISTQKSNSVKPKQRRILKTNHYLKRLLKKLRKRLVRRWQEMPFIRPNQPEGNSGLKNKQHTSPKKIKHRTVSTTEEDKISRVKSFKFRSQCSDLNINQDFITLKKTPPLKNFSALIKPMRIFTLSRLICRLPILTKIFYYSEESIPKTRTSPIVTINTGLSACIPEYKYEHTDFHNKRRSISLFNPDRTIHPYFDFVKKYPLFKKIPFNKPIKPEDRERNLHSFHKISYNNLSKTCLDDIMQQIDNSTADLFKLKEDAKKLKKYLKNSESSQQETEYFIHQLQALEKKAIKIESLRIQAMMDIINIDPNSKDSEGKILAHHLAEYGDFVLLRDLILSKKLNPFIKDNQGFLPKDTANNNRHGITEGHMKKTQEFLSGLTPENFKIYPKNPKSSITLTIDTRNFFMPRSNSSKTCSSNEGLFSQLHKNQGLMELMDGHKNDFHNIKYLCEEYIFNSPAINFKDVCNRAITSDQPFYLLLILNNFNNSTPRRSKEDFKNTPTITAIYSKKLYPFATLLYFKPQELHLNYRLDNENSFDIINRLEKSFYIFLLAMEDKDIIEKIDDKNHKKISHLKEKIKLIIPLLKCLYESIESKFKELKRTLNKIFSHGESFTSDDKSVLTEEKYPLVLKFKLDIEKNINEIIEEELINLKNKFTEICKLTVDDIKNIKTTNIYNPIFHNPPLPHTSQSYFKTEHPTNQNLINNYYPHPQSHAYQGDPQANANSTNQNLINNFHCPNPQSHAYQGNAQANANPTNQNLINNYYPHPQSHAYQGNAQANANPINQNLINNYYPHPQSHAYQGNAQANANPTNQNLINNYYPHPQSHAHQGDPQANTNPTLHLLHTLASHHPQSSHQASHSTTDQQYSSLNSDHSPAFRSEQSVSQKPQNIDSIPNLVNLSLSF